MSSGSDGNGYEDGSSNCRSRSKDVFCDCCDAHAASTSSNRSVVSGCSFWCSGRTVWYQYFLGAFNVTRGYRDVQYARFCVRYSPTITYISMESQVGSPMGSRQGLPCSMLCRRILAEGKKAGMFDCARYPDLSTIFQDRAGVKNNVDMLLSVTEACDVH
jgi:hypothetical protein